MIQFLSYPAFGNRREPFWQGVKRLGFQRAGCRLVTSWFGLKEGQRSNKRYVISFILYPIETLKCWINQYKEWYRFYSKDGQEYIPKSEIVVFVIKENLYVEE